MSFAGKTVLITGATRGIGKAMGLRLAREGANIIIAAKSVEENPKLGGTIFSAAAEMEAVGGKALAVPCDIRFEEQIQQVVEKAVSTFGGIDVLINNENQLLAVYTKTGSIKWFTQLRQYLKEKKPDHKIVYNTNYHLFHQQFLYSLVSIV